MAFFSVVIPAYNREVLIKKAVDSVLTQTFTDFEVIVVDDASKDRTAEVVQAYTDPRVKLIRQNVNGERGVARNTGNEASQGRYICYLDSDDWFEPNHLQNFYDHIIKDGQPVALYFSNIYLIDSKGVKIERHQPAYTPDDRFSYLLRYTFNPTRVCVHHSIVEDLRYDISIPGLEDLDLWLRIAIKYPLKQLQEYTCVYLEHEGSYTSGDEKRFEKELKNFQTIFSKPEFAQILPEESKSYLLSKCHYHLAIVAAGKNDKRKMYNHILQAYSLFPKGYNPNANKTMAVLFLYNIPILGLLIKTAIRFSK